jgi:hypothetical protein
MTTMKAAVRWLTREEGGRKEQPIGPRYVADGRFLAHAEKWEIEGWDLVVTKIGDMDEPTQWLAEVHFRVEEAPHEWLTPGAEFELYEGKRKVAVGRID